MTISENIDGLHATRADLLTSISTVLADVERVENALRALGVTNFSDGSASVDVLSLASAREKRGAETGALSVLHLLFQNNPAREYDASQAYEALAAEGWTSSAANPKNVIGTSLAKLMRTGELERVRHGVYRLAPRYSDGPTEMGPSEQDPPPLIPETAGG